MIAGNRARMEQLATRFANRVNRPRLTASIAAAFSLARFVFLQQRWLAAREPDHRRPA